MYRPCRLVPGNATGFVQRPGRGTAQPGRSSHLFLFRTLLSALPETNALDRLVAASIDVAAFQTSPMNPRQPPVPAPDKGQTRRQPVRSVQKPNPGRQQPLTQPSERPPTASKHFVAATWTLLQGIANSTSCRRTSLPQYLPQRSSPLQSPTL